MGFEANDQVVSNKNKDLLIRYRMEARNELEDILDYWMRFAIDDVNGGFVGKVDHKNKIDYSAPKGAVLNSRILWTFSQTALMIVHSASVNSTVGFGMVKRLDGRKSSLQL